MKEELRDRFHPVRGRKRGGGKAMGDFVIKSFILDASENN
jgi:hypothetical protein